MIAGFASMFKSFLECKASIVYAAKSYGWAFWASGKVTLTSGSQRRQNPSFSIHQLWFVWGQRYPSVMPEQLPRISSIIAAQTDSIWWKSGVQFDKFSWDSAWWIWHMSSLLGEKDTWSVQESLLDPPRSLLSFDKLYPLHFACRGWKYRICLGRG